MVVCALHLQVLPLSINMTWLQLRTKSYLSLIKHAFESSTQEVELTQGNIVRFCLKNQTRNKPGLHFQ